MLINEEMIEISSDRERTLNYLARLRKQDQAKLINLKERIFGLKKRISTLDDIIQVVIQDKQADYENESATNAETAFHKEAWARFYQASPEDLEEALQRYQIIEPYLKGEKRNDETTPARTIRDWKAKYLAAQQKYGCGYLGLLSRSNVKGNRLSKLPQDSLDLMEQFITDNYETLKQRTMWSVYCFLVEFCEEKGLLVPSYKTFTLSVHKRSSYEQILKRRSYLSSTKNCQLETSSIRRRLRQRRN